MCSSDLIIAWIHVIAVLTGAFLPFFIKGKFDKNIINFPHLVERFELLTIITFGESVVGITHFFDINNFEILPILIFLVVLSMFGSYVIQIHNLVEHHRVERSLRLMFSHYFIVISINLMTVAFELVHNGEVNHLFLSKLIIISLIIFYISILSNKEYYPKKIKLTQKNIFTIILIFIIGSTTMLLYRDNLSLLLLGTLFITLGNFGVLWKKFIEIK